MNYLKTTILLAVLTAILVFAGDAIGGRQGAITALIFAGVMNFVTYWWSDKIVLAMSSAKEIDHDSNRELYHIVENLCITAGLPVPKIYVINDTAPNAFATGRDPNHAVIAVT